VGKQANKTIIRYRNRRGRFTTAGRATRVEVTKHNGVIGFEQIQRGHFKRAEAQVIGRRLAMEEIEREQERGRQARIKLSLQEETVVEELNLMHLVGTDDISIDSSSPNIVKVSIHTGKTRKTITGTIADRQHPSKIIWKTDTQFQPRSHKVKRT